jgi:hypothetical protein
MNSKLNNYIKRQLVDKVGLVDADLFMSKHPSFNYKGINDALTNMKSSSMKYRDIEEILAKYSENPYTKRRFVHFTEKKLLPEANKTAQNQAEYDLSHVGMFLLIDQMQEIYKIEDISNLVNKFNRTSKYVDFGKLLEYYNELLLNNNLFENDMTNLRNVIENKEIKTNSNGITKEIEKLDKILESSKSKLLHLVDEEEQKHLLEEIIDVIFSVRYLAYSKYYLAAFENFIKK